jgi:hypothetical protein
LFQKFKNFWTAFFDSFKAAYNKVFKEPPKTRVQDWKEILRTNLLDIFVTKLNNLTNYQATFEVSSDSTQTEQLKELAKDIQDKRYEITAPMLADGDYFIFPATDSKGNIYHSYLTQDRVRIIQKDGEQIQKAYGIIDWYIDDDNKTYFLLRNHELDNAGALTVSYSVVDDSNKLTSLEKWDYLKDKTTRFENANHIGFGWYHSPQNDRGLSPIYGVPLNFGCAEIEARIFEDLRQIDEEFKNGKSVIFTDPRNLLPDEQKKGYKIADNVIPIQQRAGQTGGYIDIFNPTLRYSEYYSKLVGDFALYEKQVGTSKGILTDNETMNTATATAVKRSNADTIALIDKIRTAIDKGNKMTLEADAVFMNISNDLWEYQSDWFDPFEDSAEQWKQLIEAKNAGAITTKRLTKWIYPTMTDEEAEAEIAEIKAQTQIDTDEAINRILQGQ